MGKVALVLSGGGAKGAFQVGVEKYAREEKGYEWDVIAGVSVGALNGAMLSMKKYKRLEAIWKTICDNQVYTGKLNFWTYLRLLRGAKSVYGNDPLARIIDREVDPEKFVIDFRVGTVSLRTGRYTLYHHDSPDIKKAILASTVMPIIWPPMVVSDECQDMVDGSLRRFSPIGDVLDQDPEEVFIINCRPRHPTPVTQEFHNVLDIGIRTIAIAGNEIFTSDIREFIHINRNVKETEKAGLTLTNIKGKPYKWFKCTIIEPKEPLGSMLDFSKENVEMIKEKGWNRAREVLG